MARSQPLAAASVLLLAAGAAACSRPLAVARQSAIEPMAPQEIEARVAIDHRSCSPHLGLLFPGLGHLCMHQTERGTVLSALAGAEIGTAVAVGVSEGTADNPGVILPLLAVQDLWVYGVADVFITGSLARAERFTPRDSLGDLVAAPFNLQVMKRPGVWAGLTVALAVGIGVSLALSDDVDTDQVGDDPNFFGEPVDGRFAYPAGFALSGALFSHVSIAEEALFRGYIQSTMARNRGETTGWLGASLLFGAAHIPNAFALETDEERRDYLLIGIPVITGIGTYLGWIYKQSGYSLAPSTALHFWYDTLLSGAIFVLDPQNSIFSTSVAVPW